MLFSCLVMCDSLRSHGLQHARLPCLSPSSGVCSNSHPLSQWCHPTISSSVVPFSCLQSFLASRSLPVSQLFTSGGQSIGVSASASMNIQGWFSLGLIGLMSLVYKEPLRVFSIDWPWTLVQSIQFSHSVVFYSLQPHGLQHTRPPCPSPNPRVYSNSCPLSRWCHPTISSSVVPFSSCLQSFPATQSFLMTWLFASGG